MAGTDRSWDVLVIGAAGIDSCVYVADAIDWGVDGHFAEVRDGVGHAGAYTARGYAALGLRTALCAALGDDAAGDQVRTILGHEGIDLATCFVDPEGTPRSVNLVRPDGSRTAFLDARSAMHLEPDLAMMATVLATTRICHVNLPNWTRHAVPVARAAGVTVVTDLQDVHRTDDPYRLDYVDGSDIICFSTVHLGDPEPAMADYWRRRPGLVQLAGMGAAGCAVGIDGEVRRFPVPDVDLPVVDTNGAGDALAVGFVTGLLVDGLDIADAARRGQLLARLACSRRAPAPRPGTPADLRTISGGGGSHRVDP